jgi:hypothetical protein
MRSARKITPRKPHFFMDNLHQRVFSIMILIEYHFVKGGFYFRIALAGLPRSAGLAGPRAGNCPNLG